MLRRLLLALLLILPGLAQASSQTLAVLYFDNSGGEEYDALKVGLAQMLINDLVGTEGVQVVERAELQALLDELELGHSGMVDPDTAAKVGKLLGARWLAMGTYFEMAGTLYVQSRLVRVETGEIVEAWSVQDEASAFLALEQQLATAYQEALAERVSSEPAPETGQGQAPDDEGAPSTRGQAGSRTAATEPGSPPEANGRAGAGEATVAAPDPEALDAAIAFSEGLIHLDQKDPSRAREAFQQALASDPDLEDAQQQLAALEL